MICIQCPMGCNLVVEQQNEKVIVTGNKCRRGQFYAEQEILSPKRIITTTVKLDGGLYPVIPVKTADPVPKSKIFDIMESLSELEIKAPVNVGDVVAKNILGTGVDVIITKNDSGEK